MSLTITTDLIRELVDRPIDTGVEAHDVGIVLGEHGWEVAVEIPPGAIVAYTRDQVYDYTDGAPLTDEDAESLADHDPIGGDWTIRSADPVDPDAEWVIALPDDADTLDEAVALDSRHVSRMIGDLWVAGRDQDHYLMSTRQGPWELVTADFAAEYAFAADPDDLVADGDAPTLIRVAVAMRAAVDMIPVHEVPPLPDDDLLTQRAHHMLPGAAQTFADAGVITRLLRDVVPAEVRQRRAASAWVAINAYRGHHASAAEALGVSKSRFSKILNGRNM